MPTIHVEGRPYEVPEGLNLLDACLSLGFDVPHFCWHPALGSVGACRQCAVKQFKDENDTKGVIVMACMTPARDGTRVSIADAEAAEFRRSVVEWLMLNHPHDCPVCDEGGECHLQDMTVMTGHDYRKTRLPKRTFRNQDLGPFVAHEMNRCIECYRCVRFYRDYAGGRDFGVFGAHDHVYFGRMESGALASEFSGNLVEVCPTGVFTDKTLHSHYARKWDLSTAPSVCVHCSLGCNTLPGERYGMLRRVRNRYHPDVNGYFLCDRGRYGYEFVNGERRLTLALARGEPVSPEAAVEEASRLLAAARGVVGIGSPRATLETLFALRELVGPERLCSGLAARDLEPLRRAMRGLSGAVPAASLADVRAADAALLLGGDPTGGAPMLALALRRSARVAPVARLASHVPAWNDAAVRQAIQREAGPLFVASTAPARVDDIATARVVSAPADVARLGFAVARRLGAAGDEVRLHRDAHAFARDAAAALAAAERPVVVADAASGEAVVAAAAEVAEALAARGSGVRLALALPECDSAGLALVGGFPLEDALASLRSGEADTLVVAENDLFRRLPPALAEELLSLARGVIALDCVRTPTVERAHVALPAATFADGTGTLVSSEGRAQRSFAAMPPSGDARESWKWLARLAGDAGGGGRWETEDAVLDALSGLPGLAGARDAAPPASFRLVGMKVAREPHRYSGRTSMRADVDVKEGQPPADADSPLAFTMQGFQGFPPPPLVPRYWAGGWNSVQALLRYQVQAGGALRGGSPGIRLLDGGRSDGGSPSAEAGRFPVPEAFEPRRGEWLLVGAPAIFGSEELSSLSPSVASLAPRPYVGLSPEDAERAGLREGGRVRVGAGEASAELPLRLVPGLPRGVAIVPEGLRAMPAEVRPGGYARVEAAGEEAEPR